MMLRRGIIDDRARQGHGTVVDDAEAVLMYDRDRQGNGLVDGVAKVGARVTNLPSLLSTVKLWSWLLLLV